MPASVGHQVMPDVKEMPLACVQFPLELMWNLQKDLRIGFHVKPVILGMLGRASPPKKRYL